MELSRRKLISGSVALGVFAGLRAADARVPEGAFPTRGLIKGLNYYRNLGAAVRRVKAGTGRAKHFAVGDSLTVGAGAGTTGNDNTVDAYPVSFPSLLTTAFSAAGIPTINSSSCTDHSIDGLGVTPALSDVSNYDPRNAFGTNWTSSGAPASYSLGGYMIQQLSSTGTAWSFAPGIATNKLDVLAGTYTGAGTATVDIGGSPVLSQSLAGATGTILVTASATPGVNTWNLKLTSVGNGAIFTLLDAYNSASPALSVYNMGASGTLTSSWAGATAEPWSAMNCLGVLSPNLISIELGANDSASAVSAATYYANMKTIILAALATGADVQLMAPHPALSAAFTGNIPATYRQALRQLADEHQLPQVIDFQNVAPLSYYTGDGNDIHLTSYQPKANYAAPIMLSRML